MHNNGVPQDDTPPPLQPSVILTSIGMQVAHQPGNPVKMLVIEMGLQLSMPFTPDSSQELVKMLTGGIEIHTKLPPS